MILQYTGGFFSAHGWQSWADVILRIKNDDEMIYDCSKEAIEDFYFFKDNFTRLYEQTPYKINGTDAEFLRALFDTMPECQETTPNNWFNQHDGGYCEVCGIYGYRHYYPNCSNIANGWGHWAGDDCETCSPLAPSALHLEICYNFMEQSGLLNLIYQQVEFVESYYERCVNPLI